MTDRHWVRVIPTRGLSVEELVADARQAKSDWELVAQEAGELSRVYREGVCELVAAVGPTKAGRLLGISRQQVYRLTRVENRGIRQSGEGDSPMKYTHEDLEDLPTLSQGQADDLKIHDGDTKVWLSRMSVEDGMPYENQITVERLVDGRWETVEEYEG